MCKVCTCLVSHYSISQCTLKEGSRKYVYNSGFYQLTKYICINNESTDSIQGHDKFNAMDYW